MLSLAPYRHWLAWALLLATPVAAQMRPVQGRRRQQHAARQLIQPWRAEALRQRTDPGRVPADRRQAAAGESGIWPAQRAAGARPWPHPRGGRHGLQPAGLHSAPQPPRRLRAAAGRCGGLPGQPPRGDPTALAAACREGVPGMCLQLADRWHDEARAPATPDEARSNRPSSIPHWPASNCLCRAGMAASATRHRPAQRLEADPALQEQIVKAAMGAAMVEAVSSVLSPSTPVVVPAAPAAVAVVPAGRPWRLLQPRGRALVGIRRPLAGGAGTGHSVRARQ